MENNILTLAQMHTMSIDEITNAYRNGARLEGTILEIQIPMQIPTVTPTEAVTYYNLLIIGVIGGIGTFALTQFIKHKNSVPVGRLAMWAAVFGVATLASVWDIARRSEN